MDVVYQKKDAYKDKDFGLYAKPRLNKRLGFAHEIALAIF
jgi:hypothetical protein